MMRKRILFFAIFFAISTLTFSQVKWRVWYPIPVVGYVWQKTHNLEIGASFNLTNYTGRRHMMISFPIGMDLFWYQKRNYVSPFISAKYYMSLTKQLHGIDISLIYWRSRINGIVDHRLTPEIGLVFFQHFRVSYGYNFRIGLDELNNFGKHRVSIRIPGI